ncbi:group 1 truncated hemoglobin [Glaciecola sp. SC05]|uniref:group I truncated hemoglobin n=1 Tax=Glaciecola sp. SC05 TaxID=1987355 RepID=UPI0035288C7C
MLFRTLAILCVGVLCACSSTSNKSDISVYEQIGGAEKVAEVVDNFITEIEFSPEIFPYFENTDVDRFREKLIEHLCMLTAGPCEYNGDTMVQVHGGMGITEHDFNLGVDLFINAMDKADIPHRLQNKVIATMAPTRADIIYQ